MPSGTASVILPVPEGGSAVLVELGKCVLRSTSSAEQKSLCSQISKQLPLGGFPFVFAGVLLARQKRLQEAAHMLSFATGNAFAFHLKDQLASKNSLRPSAELFESAAPLNAWTRTPISRLEMRATVDAFARFALESGRLAQDTVPVILDVGTGNGILVSHLINRLAQDGGFPAVRLFLLDRSAEMLRVATHNCKRTIRGTLHVSTIQSSVESFAKSHVPALTKENISFVTAAGCLHHLSQKAKHRALTLLRRVSPTLFLEELEANHDLPETDSPELIWSVQHFYGSLIESVEKSRLERSVKTSCIHDFLLVEAAGILSAPKTQRGNYHALLPEWRDIASKAGFQVMNTRTCVLDKRGLRSLALHLVSDFKIPSNRRLRHD